MGRKNFEFCWPVFFLKSVGGDGITLVEVIIAVAVVAIIALMFIFSLPPQIQLAKANDSRRKSDLQRISTALEDYAGDYPCYPVAIYQGDGCVSSDEISPYLKKIPCDPRTGEQYPYFRPDDCSQFVLYATLQSESANNYGSGNYALTSPGLRVIPTFQPTPAREGISSPTTFPSSAPSLEPTPPVPEDCFTSFWYGCKNGVCVSLSNCLECPSINYRVPDCDNRCSNPLNSCR